MGRASNYIGESGRAPAPGGSGGVAAPSPAAVFRPAAPREVAGALRLVLGSPAQPADETQVYDFMQFASRRGLNVACTWLAERGGGVVWAVLPIVSPGRTMLILGPAGAPADPASGAAAGGLVDAVCTHFGARDVQLAQVLLDPADAASHRLYQGHAFNPVARLIYLQVAPRRKASAPPLPPRFSWAPYGPASHELFARTITRTYHQSLDCPSLNGLRDIEDVLAGHKASGDFDPRLWALLCEGDEPLGALLLSHTRAAETTELVYLGLVPEGRGRGLAELMMRQALAAAAAQRGGRLSLAVDSGNVPALKLYHRHGMQEVGAKLAMMRDLRP